KVLIGSTPPPFLAQNLVDLTIDTRVLLFTLGVSVLTSLVFGLVPAIQSSRQGGVSALREEAGTARCCPSPRPLRRSRRPPGPRTYLSLEVSSEASSSRDNPKTRPAFW